MACSFAGLCYAELASMIPIAGSAYTYSYATLGELVAWIIGWDLILEYAVSNVAVAVGFGGYVKAQLGALRLAHCRISGRRRSIPEAWTGAYFNVPAFLIVFVLTVLLVRGVRESAEANNVMVAIKIGAILMFLVVGGMLVNRANWHPFAPCGFPGSSPAAPSFSSPTSASTRFPPRPRRRRIRRRTFPSASSPRSSSAPCSMSAWPWCCSA